MTFIHLHVHVYIIFTCIPIHLFTYCTSIHFFLSPKGLSLHTFHGNFFVRSTDLLSLPNVNPDHGYCMNLAIDESLKDYSMVCFQAALLYTSYRGRVYNVHVHACTCTLYMYTVHVHACVCF